MKNKCGLPIRCNVHIETGRIVNGNEVLERHIDKHNLAADVGLEYIRDHGMASFDTMAYGSGDTAPAHDDTALEAEEFTEALSIDPALDSGSGYAVITYYHYLGAAAGELGALTEAGIFAGETMIARVTFDSITKQATTYIKVVWDIVVSSAELS